MDNEQIVRAIQRGENREENLMLLYERNQGMVRTFLRKYAGCEEEEDLRQQAFIALMLAADEWQEDKGAQFSTLAFLVIDRELKRYLDYKSHLVRVPAGAEQVTVQSLNTPLSEDTDAELQDTIPDRGDHIRDIERRIWNQELSQVLWSAVDQLKMEQQMVVLMRYRNGSKDDVIAEMLGCSVASVRRLKDRALMELRKPKYGLGSFAESADAIYSKGLRGTGLTRYRHTGTSATERIALINIEREKSRLGKMIAKAL